MSIQEECYTQIEPESRASMLSKIKLSAKTCWLATQDDEVSAYLLCHPWISDSPPALDMTITMLPENANCFYFHDLAVGSAGRYKGLANNLVNHALNYAKNSGFKQAALIAVQDSSSFWAKFGFAPSTSLTAAHTKKIKTYGNSAIYMRNNLAKQCTVLVQSGCKSACDCAASLF